MRYLVNSDHLIPITESNKGLFCRLYDDVMKPAGDSEYNELEYLIEHNNVLFIHPDYYVYLKKDANFEKQFKNNNGYRELDYICEMLRSRKVNDNIIVIYKIAYQPERGFRVYYLLHKKDYFTGMIRKIIIDEFLNDN